jgi:hypothetical protein
VGRPPRAALWGVHLAPSLWGVHPVSEDFRQWRHIPDTYIRVSCILDPALPPSASPAAVPSQAAGPERFNQKESAMSNGHIKTLEQLFAHPTSHNIHWRDVVRMLEAHGATCTETKHDHLKVVLGRHEMTFHIPHGSHALESDHEIAAIRRFLRQCGLEPVGNAS